MRRPGASMCVTFTAHAASAGLYHDLVVDWTPMRAGSTARGYPHDCVRCLSWRLINWSPLMVGVWRLQAWLLEWCAGGNQGVPSHLHRRGASSSRALPKRGPVACAGYMGALPGLPRRHHLVDSRCAVVAWAAGGTRHGSPALCRTYPATCSGWRQCYCKRSGWGWGWGWGW